MDYLDSIDCSLEDFQAMLYGKQCGIDFDVLEVKYDGTHVNKHLPTELLAPSLSISDQFYYQGLIS